MTPFTKYKHINLTYLQEVLGDDQMILIMTINKFLAGTPPIMSEMDIQLEAEEIDGFGKLAHKLKSSVGFMGMAEAQDMLIKMEGICAHKDQVSTLPTLWKATKVLLEAGMEELRKAIAQLQK